MDSEWRAKYVRTKAKRNDPEALVFAFASGTDLAGKVSVYAQSADFAVFRVEGHKYWNGRFSPQGYAPTRHVLIRKGHFCIGQDQREWTGRITKTVAQQITEALRLSQENNCV